LYKTDAQRRSLMEAFDSNLARRERSGFEYFVN